MIERIIAASLNNRIIVFIGIALLLVWGLWALQRTPVDAIPDLSDNQVIVMTDWMGRAPEVIENQITYPMEAGFRGLPGVKAVRGQSMFGLSMIYIIFEDKVDIYWARTRVMERLNQISPTLPKGTMTAIGPDGTGVGHVYWYTVEGNGYDLAKLRSVQDWYIKPALSSVEGVAEIASIGGFVKQYQVLLKPDRLQYYGISTMMAMDAVKKSNLDVGGGLLEQSSMEYMIRGLGYIQSKEDIEQIVVMATADGKPIRIADIGIVQMGGAARRGILEKNGNGEVVGGIVVMRYGENAQQVIDRVKERIASISPGLPEGITLQMAYDRSDLIQRALDTLVHSLWEEILIVSIVVLIFLFHFRSAVVVIIALPLAILSAFITMYYFRISSNLMSLSGIAIAIGVMVDAGIVIVENAYRKLSEGTDEDRNDIIKTVYNSSKTVGRPIFFSLGIIVLSFLPVFLLEGQEGKLFIPLAFTKTAAMVASALLAITLTPVLCTLLLKGKLKQEDDNPLSRWLNAMYRPMLRWALNHKWTTLWINIIVLLGTIVLMTRIGSEFMPALDEGSLLFMPTTLPNVSVTEAKRIMQVQDKIIAAHPEVALVLGKAGRAETATDPAPVSMIETIILLTPHEQWRKGITRDDIVGELDQQLQVPGVSNGWTQPIINRINMLATGVRTDLGIKILGDDLQQLEQLAIQAEQIVKKIPGAVDVSAERVIGGNYIDVRPDRMKIAQYGLSMEEVLSTVETATGGMIATEVVEGRERYGVFLRYALDYRSSLEDVKRTTVTSMSGAQVPLSSIAEVTLRIGASMIASENSHLRSIVYLNVRDRDLGGFVTEAKAAIERDLKLPAGYFVEWSGQWEHQVRAKQRLLFILPIVVLVIFLLLYFTFHSFSEAGLVMLSVPFSLTGGALLIYFLNYNFSVAVWVGFIGLYGVAVETGVIMVVYLHEALNQRLRNGAVDRNGLYEAIEQGSVLRLRPKLMTVGTSMIGLLPVMWSMGTGADLMKPIATPMVGGLFTSAVHVLLVTPVIFALMKERELKKHGKIEVSHIAGD
ncbi:MAG: CusA/CzcA family heavy metal efflux RND transporter [bacterium]|nr:CusA/CzcA family heavy metal efflux RND transporter [bacterium]